MLLLTITSCVNRGSNNVKEDFPNQNDTFFNQDPTCHPDWKGALDTWPTIEDVLKDTVLSEEGKEKVIGILQSYGITE